MVQGEDVPFFVASNFFSDDFCSSGALAYTSLIQCLSKPLRRIKFLRLRFFFSVPGTFEMTGLQLLPPGSTAELQQAEHDLHHS